MTTNIVEAVKDAISERLLEQLGGLLGESPEVTANAFAAAVPVVLGGMVKQAVEPEGATALEQAVSKEDGGLLNNVEGMFADGPTSSVFQSGGALLGRMFGRNLGQIVEAVSRAAGISEVSAGKVLAFAGPVILGVLRQQAVASGSSSNGVSGLLASQKDSIAQMMPSELAKNLDLDHMVSNVSRSPFDISGNTLQAANPASKSGGSLLKLLVLLLLVGGLGFLGWRAMEPAESEESDDGGISVDLGDGESLDVVLPPLDDDEGGEEATDQSVNWR